MFLVTVIRIISHFLLLSLRQALCRNTRQGLQHQFLSYLLRQVHKNVRIPEEGKDLEQCTGYSEYLSHFMCYCLEIPGA
jgi:hypothetical protein